MKARDTYWPGRAVGFSLIELLTVIALLGILSVLVVPSIRGISSATELSMSGATLVDSLNLARQTALSANRPVEVRFYEAARTTDPSPAFRAMGIYVISNTGTNQMGKLAWLRNNVVMSDTDTFGTLLKGLPTGQASLPGFGATNFNYRSLIFRPDGSASLPHMSSVGGTNTWHVMLYDTTHPPTGSTPPSNHVTIQLLPETGRTRTFQPGAD